MAQLPPVKIPKNKWVDLYSETGIAVGSPVIIHNNSDLPVIIADSALQPSSGFGFDNVDPNEYVTTNGVVSGAWAYSSHEITLQVDEVS